VAYIMYPKPAMIKSATMGITTLALGGIFFQITETCRKKRLIRSPMVYLFKSV